MRTICSTLTGQRMNIGFYERNMKQTRVGSDVNAKVYFRKALDGHIL